MNSIFDGLISENKTGFRLHRLEVLNWGTFDGKIYSIIQDGQNALLTGDIGSGKSTLVDALTTLLVPHNKIIYNKAAGAENRTERNLVTYIRGEHTNKKDEVTGSSKPVYLRGDDKYTVLLGYFYNEGYEHEVTLAQVFWLKNNKPEKFFIISGSNLNIKDHFSNFGDDISKLRKRLREKASTEVFEAFSAYSDRFRQLFGIKQPEALDLFYQTVSMKSVGNLTDFVRNQMLGKTEVKDKIEELVKSFDNLTETHNAVLKAKKQLEILNPVIADITKYDEFIIKLKQEKTISENLPKYFSLEKVRLFKAELKLEKENYLAQINKGLSIKGDIEKDRGALEKIKSSLANSEIGKQLESMELRIIQLGDEIKAQQEKYSEYQKLCITLNLDAEINESTFYANRKKIDDIEKGISETIDRLIIERDNLKLEEAQKKNELRLLKIDLESLRSRKSQIPTKNLEVRTQIATALEIDIEDIPFAGELMRVKDDERDWEGAIERRLSDLGQSLLVPEIHYKRIMNYVNKTDLNRRLVYLRVIEHDKKREVNLKDNSLVYKVEVKNDSDFAEWLERELEIKHNLSCCETTEEYHQEYYAITKSGQIKTGRTRNEKDDRRNIHDRRFYILGWSNTSKIELLEKDFISLEEELKKFDIKVKSVEDRQSIQGQLRIAINSLKSFTDFTFINFKKSVVEKEALAKDLSKLKASKGSEQYNKLKEQVGSLGIELKRKDSEHEAILKETGKTEDKISGYAVQLFNNLKVASTLDQFELQDIFNFGKSIFENIEEHISNWVDVSVNEELIEKEQELVISKLIEEYSLTILSVESIQKKLVEQCNKRIGQINQDSSNLTNSIVRGMQKFKGEFQAESSDFEATLEYIDEIRKIHAKISEDDLPKHEERFKKLLRENTIKELLLFNSSLYKFEKEIKRKIEEINNHLKKIDYNLGTYITIIEDKVTTQDITDFKNDLKRSTEGVFGETDLYSEDKFLEVKKLLDKFKSVSDDDKKWTQKVTDVRHWFTFGASERNREDDVEREYYSDSSGKSGGQKEKLAYTILASAIAYQFGLEFGETRSRSFRFVVIDEAFGRGSDDSTRYGLKLFKELNLQLLIVTPLQKINIIEDYISAVHFVSNPTGNKSLVRNLNKSLYLKEKEEYFSHHTAK